jgi:Ca-activated chloride channel family protein
MHSKVNQEQEMITVWHERFYWFLAPAMITFLFYILAVKQELLLLIIFFAAAYPKTSYAREFKDYFKNKEEIALEQYNQRDYEQAKSNFIDPYRQGVAAYRAGLYNEAEQAFKKSKRSEVKISALYNLGNSLALQNKLQEAVASYEMVLQSQPDHKDAQENLKIVKDLLEQEQEQEQEKEQGQEKEQDQTKEQDQSKDNKQEQDKNKDKDPNRDQNKNTENNETSDQSKEDQTKPEQDTQPPPSKEVSSVQQDEKSVEEIKADKWLNQLDNDLKTFLHNKFYIEEHKARRGDY